MIDLLKPWVKRGLVLLIAVVFVIMEIDVLYMYKKSLEYRIFTDNQFKFQSLAINPDWVSQCMEEKESLKKDNMLKKMSLGMLYHDFDLVDKERLNQIPLLWKWVMEKETYSAYYEKYKTIFFDLKEFPVPEDVEGGATISYEDSWGAVRNYGGERVHEGTDIMTSNNERGYFPIISITDGIVEKMGWLEKGGYRIGIRSPSGAYFYYAHLCEYAPDLEVGEPVKAGRLLGSMGDTGYGKEEGTVGKFDVHLHLGIYLDVDGEEVAVNPYYIIKALEKKRITFRRKVE